MAVDAPPKVGEVIAGELKPSGARRRDTARSWGLGIWSALALLYLFIPIFVIVAFSFNDNKGRFNFTWQGFTLDHWAHPFANPDLATAMKNSLTIALITTIIIAHVMFTVSYVVVTVKARLEGMDRHIEEAAMDLGATEWTTFRKVTLPMIAPGVAAAALLAAAISVDDYVITSFNAGQTVTFPLFIFGATRQGVPPEVNVLATGLLIVVLILMGLNVMLQRRLARRDAALQTAA
jgi:spermidine/putrescine transport system permease protein